MGAVKILFGVSLIYWNLAKYAISCFFTYFASEDFSCIAWDSAGAVKRTLCYALSVCKHLS